MRLNELQLNSFRSCKDTRVPFPGPLTLLVGENDGGKSNIIDAIRLTTPSVSGIRSLWFDPQRDLSRHSPDGTQIEVVRRFSKLSRSETAFYMPSLVDRHDDLIRTTRFDTNTNTAKWKRTTDLVGDSKVADPEPDTRGRIAHVYLPALRDASRELDSSSGNRLASVIELIASKEEIEAFEKQANEAMESLASNSISIRVKDSIQSHLTSVTEPVQHRIVGIGHGDQRLRTLARALRLNMAAVGVDPGDLMNSGLGYANLLYMATIVLELEKAKDYDLLLLLVEEPEAHLHPQLQTVLLSYLEQQAADSLENVVPGQPAGLIQVIATSHSPELASSLSTSSLVVVRQTEGSAIPSRADDESDDEDDNGASIIKPVADISTKALALAEIDLSSRERRKIDRYLDATRSTLLFARQVILVEGVSEAVLLRTLAEEYVFPKTKDAVDHGNREKREQFRAISVIPIGGVDFRPYVQLLLGGDMALTDKLVVITDGDDGPGANRESALREEFFTDIANRALSIHVCETTFEAELYGPKKNEPVLRAAFKIQHPCSLDKWDAISSTESGTPSTEDRASAFRAKLKSGDLDLGKGDFAQVVLEALTPDEGVVDFEVPQYLVNAIESALVSVSSLVNPIKATSGTN